MSKPKFTDLHRYPRGYRTSCNTDISETWKAARKQLEADKLEREQKVREIKQLGKAK